MLSHLLKWLTSLRLTVTLLVFGIALVFFGTLAQTSDGLWIAQERYFRSWFATWNPHNLPWLKIPLPGGYLIGVLLLFNLIAAHVTRFKFTWKKSGIFLTHLGVILLLVGQLATDLFARESRMSFGEGDRRNYTEDFQQTELVFIRETGTNGLEEVIALPESLLARKGDIQHPSLPFRITIREYHENAQIRGRGPMVDAGRSAASTAGIGAKAVLEGVAPTRAMDKRNLPAVVFSLSGTSTSAQETWLCALVLDPQEIPSTPQPFRVQLRQRRYYENFSIRLLKTTHDVYPGTDTPRDFRSRVRIEPAGNQTPREVDIYMNNPLRYAGLTFFQSQMGREEFQSNMRGNSVLQVVRNPSWLTPYAGCGLVGVGLIVQFMIHLVGFMAKPRPKRATA